MISLFILVKMSCSGGMSEKEQFWYDKGVADAERKSDGRDSSVFYKLSEEEPQNMAKLNGCPPNYESFFIKGYRKVIDEVNEDYRRRSKMYDNK